MSRSYHNTQSHQETSTPPDMKHEWLNVASVSAPSFGSTFQINLNEKNVSIHELILAFTISAITGLTGSVTNYPNLTPVDFWIQKMEIVIGGVVVENFWGEHNWMMF